VGALSWCARALLAGAICLAPSGNASADDTCGEIVSLETHGRSTTSYSLAVPPAAAASQVKATPAVLVLLPGSSGSVALDSNGCATRLRGNWLVRSRDLFRQAGLGTALVDAPSDHRGEDGLRGFRLAERHAEDVGKVIADLRTRTGAPVWLVGTSRGSISAANAASRLTGPGAPDGIILASPVTSGRASGYKPWLAQTVLRTELEAIRVPVLVVAHAADTCVRSPPGLAGSIAARANGSREQTVTVTGGQSGRRDAGMGACEGRSHHGFLGQEAEVIAGIARFVRGEPY
jgi:hypothetical protein